MRTALNFRFTWIKLWNGVQKTGFILMQANAQY